jgi:hypothetical protein
MAVVKVEFAGLVVAVVPPGKDSVSVLLLDARAVGGPAHSSVLLIKDVPGLKGSPDFTITRPSSIKLCGPDGAYHPDNEEAPEFAGWFLRGDVEFSGNLAPFSKPNLAKTMDIKRIGDARKLVPANLRPLSATVRLDKGQLSSSGVAHYYDFHYFQDGEKRRVYGPGNEVELTDRMSCDLGEIKGSFQVSFQGITGGRTVVTISDTADLDEPILISNLAGGSVKAGEHFDAYFVLADSKRTPSIKQYPRPEQVGVDIPDNPDECRAARFEE